MRATIRRLWLQGSSMHDVLKLLKLARGPSITQALTASLIGFAMRRYPGHALLGIAPLDDIHVQKQICVLHK